MNPFPGSVSGVSPSPWSKSGMSWSVGEVINTSHDAPLPCIVNVNVSSSSIRLSSSIPTVIAAELLLITNCPCNWLPIISSCVIPVPLNVNMQLFH